MTPIVFMLLVFAASVAAGFIGATLGLGGGIIVVPALTLLLHVDIRYAIGASIVAVIATSSGAGATYVKQRLTNIRVAMFLEVATTLGAIAGAFVAGMIEGRWLFILFGTLLAVTAAMMWRGSGDATQPSRRDRIAERLRLHGSYFDQATGQMVDYRVTRTGLGFFISAIAGMVSGLLGIGGGVIKVPAMNLGMRMPLKAASATSNFMIGVTAAASAGVYFSRGDIDPFVAGPVSVGVLVGAFIGARVLPHSKSRVLRAAFTVVLIIVAIEMLLKGLQ